MKGFYRKHIHNYAKIATPLTNLTRKTQTFNPCAASHFYPKPTRAASQFCIFFLCFQKILNHVKIMKTREKVVLESKKILKITC